MATDAKLTDVARRPVVAEVVREFDSPAKIVRDALSFFASLKLTVVLFSMAIFMIMVVTLAQAHMDMWQATKTFFKPAWGVAWINVSIFYPPAWFPHTTSEAKSSYFAIFALLCTPVFTALCYAMLKKSMFRVPLTLIVATAGVMTSIFVMAWGGFVFPSGAAIGTALIINLLAAHGIRFKIQGSGTQLALGVVVLAVGALATWYVIQTGHNQEGMQEVNFAENAFLYATVWTGFKVVLTLLSLAATAALIRYAIDGYANRVELWIFAIPVVLILLPISAWLWWAGKDAMLYESGMRIFWQLVKSLFAALILLGGSMLIFKKRAGIVVIHAGLLLMMSGEVLVSYFAVESQMQLREGETKNYAEDIRATEFAIVDPSDKDTDKVVVVPGDVLARETKVTDSNLPFDFKCEQFMVNTQHKMAGNGGIRLLTAKEAGLGSDNPATAGFAKDLGLVALEAAPTTGTEGGDTDFASAYVTLYNKKTDKSLGTYLFSLLLVNEQPIKVDGKTYQVSLRWKRVYKDYIVQLRDVRSDTYLGTSTPRDYSSYVRIVNNRTGEHRDKIRIWMNNPLRAWGDTFYQSSYQQGVDDNGRPYEATVLSIVSNLGWMIPYTACVIVGVGLLAHFIPVLLRFLKRDRLRGPKAIAIAFPLLVLACGVAYTVWSAEPTADNGMQIHEIGRQPVIGDGRVKPFDTLARDTLQVLSDKSTFSAVMRPEQLKQAWDKIAGKVGSRWPQVPRQEIDKVQGDVAGLIDLIEKHTDDKREFIEFNVDEIVSQRQPAIVWLLDVISNSPRGREHKVFRIENSQVLDLFDLEPRPGFRYSYNELKDGLEALRKQEEEAQAAMKADKYGLNPYQKKVIELQRKIQLFDMFEVAFRVPEYNPAKDADAAYHFAEEIGRGLSLAEARIPLVVPVSDVFESWWPLPTAVVRNQTLEYAHAKGLGKIRDVAQQIAEAGVGQLVHQLALESVIEDILRMHNPGLSEEEARRQASERARNMPPEVQAMTKTLVDQRVKEMEAAQGMPALRGKYVDHVKGLVTSLISDVNEPPDPVAAHFGAMLVAYRHDDVKTFNSELAAYQQALAAVDPEKLHPGDSWMANLVADHFGSYYQFEEWFNGFAPFTVACVLYVVALVLALLAGLGFTATLNRAAFWLICFTFLVHTFALICRIYLSGRPPVTNLYSSAVFIGWACVLFGIALEALFRLGVGNIVAALAGFPTLLISFALANDGDSIAVLQAVLDTQFWLATHVVCITLGYAATFLAGILGLVYIGRGLLVPWAGRLCREKLLPAVEGSMSPERYSNWQTRLTPDVSPEYARELVRMIYGILCFAIIFSFIGTVLGGLWADDSWGRFWGWDPKENGALIIVLWNAVVLHARWDGMVRDRGLAILSLVGNVVTSWSWFGVNELGIGLHAYGFTEGRLQMLGLFILSQLLIVGLAALLPKRFWWNREKTAAA